MRVAVTFSGELDRAREMADLTAVLHASEDLDRAVQALLTTLPQLLPDLTGSVLVLNRRRLTAVGAGDERLKAADQVQFQFHQGPAFDIVAGASTSFVPDLRIADRQWPQWAPAAIGLGIRGVLAVRLADRGGGLLGVLSVAHAEADAITTEHVDTVQLLAPHLSTCLAAIRVRDNLRLALRNNSEVGQAIGVLMERFDLDAAQAFTVLRRYSQDLNKRVREIAAEVVETRRLPDIRTVSADSRREGWVPGSGD